MAEIGVMKKLTIGGSTYTIPEYNLPIASASTLGGVKIGTGLSINSTTGVLSATGLDYDEADPIFVASAAHGITQNDISNWNSKTSNIGTITSVKTTAGAHTAINVTSGAAAFNVPTKTSHLTNDSGFLTSHQTLYEENIQWGPTSVSKVGSVSPIGMSLSSEHSANRLAFINGDALTFEYSSNGGSSYTNYNYDKSTKSAFCTTSYAVPIGRVSGNYTTSSRTRVTLTAQNGTIGYVYTNPKKILINVSSSGAMNVLIEYRTGTNYQNNGSWATFGTYDLSGWSGWNDIPLNLGTLGGGTTQTSNNWQLRLTFVMTSVNSSYPTTAYVNSIRLFGENGWTVTSNMGATGHLYSYDINQNATFPAKVTATGGFNGNLTGDVTGNVSGSAGSVAWSGITSKPTTLSGYGITDAYTKTEVNGLVSGVLHYKGTKATVADVAAITSKSIGDVWHVTADGSEWAYDGDAWQELGTAIDLSGYVTTDDSRLSDARTPLAHNQALSTITGADDLKAIEALTGTSGLLKKTAANTWTLDTNTYLTSYTETDPTVPSWAKASTKPTYTATEVGALPSTTVIPSKTSDLTNDSGFITSYTDEKLKWTASTSSNTYYPLQSTSTATTSTANTLNSVSFYQYYNTAGGYRRLVLGNATAYTSTGGAYGAIRLYGAAATYYGDLVPGVLSTSSSGRLTANRTWTFPDKTGTVALTSDIPTVSYPVTSVNTKTGAVVLTASDVGALPDTTVIPTVPTNISAFTNDSGYITSADVPEGASAYTGTISAVTSGNASAGSNNGFARGDHTHNITKTTIDTVLGTGSGTTKFYREDGTWVTPAYPTTYSLGLYGTSGSSNSSQWTQAFSTKLYFKAGDNMGLTKDGNNIIFNAIIPASTQSATTGITATTTATKTTLGTATSVTGVSGSTTASKASGSNGSASNWVFEDVACDDITAWSAGSGNASLTFTMDTTDTKKLKISFSHTHTAPSLTYSAKTASHVKSGGNGTAPSWSFTDVTVPKAAASATSVPNVSVTSATVSITDNGHTHTI